MSMTSARPPTSGHESISVISGARKSAPESSSPGADGTQDGAMKMKRSGRCRLASTA